MIELIELLESISGASTSICYFFHSRLCSGSFGVDEIYSVLKSIYEEPCFTCLDRDAFFSLFAEFDRVYVVTMFRKEGANTSDRRRPIVKCKLCSG